MFKTININCSGTSRQSSQPILKTLEKISSKKGWDHKAMDQAYGLIKNLTEPTFLVALRVCAYTLGFTKPLSTML